MLFIPFLINEIKNTAKQLKTFWFCNKTSEIILCKLYIVTCKQILGLPKHAYNDIVLSELTRTPLSVAMERQMETIIGKLF